MKEIDYKKPVHITDDIWFYPSPKTLYFVVWQRGVDGKRVCTQFTIRHKKLKKYMTK